MSSVLSITSPIIVALDFPDMASALLMADRLDPSLCRVKVGKELFTTAGPAVVEQLQAKGFEVFLDLKFHDIPNTTAKAVAAAARLGVWMVNVHASGGTRMMAAAREELEKMNGPVPLLIAVTVLTSMESQDLAEVGIDKAPMEQVLHLAKLTQAAGLDGVVCSAQESVMLKDAIGTGFSLVTPGIRLATDASGDQRRIMTPVDAMRAGSDYLVIGRPITQAADPVAILTKISTDLKNLI